MSSRERWLEKQVGKNPSVQLAARGTMAPKKVTMNGLTGQCGSVPFPDWAKWRLSKEELKLVTPAEIGVRVSTWRLTGLVAAVIPASHVVLVIRQSSVTAGGGGSAQSVRGVFASRCSSGSY